MKMTGHFDPDAVSRRRSSIPEIPSRWMSSSRQVAVCTLSLSSNASADANVRLSMPWRANSRDTLFRMPALSSTTITPVGRANASDHASLVRLFSDSRLRGDLVKRRRRAAEIA